MCLRTVNIDEARLCKINPSFSDMKTIDRWLEVIINDAISEMEVKQRMAGLEVEVDPIEEDEALAVAPVVSAQKYPYDRDMTVEELYAAVVEDIKEIYAK